MPIKGASITIVPMSKTVPIIVEHIIHEVCSTKGRQTLKVKKPTRPLRKLQDSSNTFYCMNMINHIYRYRTK